MNNNAEGGQGAIGVRGGSAAYWGVILSRLGGRRGATALLIGILRIGSPLGASLGAQRPASKLGSCPRVKTALVLAGGGAKGAAHIGVLRVLDSLGIVPDIVIGTSIGAIVGALYSSGYSGAQIDSLTRVYPLGSLVRSYQPRLPQSVGVGLTPSIVWQSRTSDWVMQSGAIRESDVHAVINALMLRGNLQARGNFDSLPIPFRAVATDLADRKTVVIGEGDLARAVRASFSIPMVFEPMHLNGQVLVDGGVSSNVPISVARELGAQRVIVSMLNGELVDSGSVGSTLSTASKLIDFLFLQPLDSLGPTDVLVRSELSQYGLLDFAPKKMAEMARLGYHNAEQAFASASCMPSGGVKRDVPVPRMFRGLQTHPDEETLAPIVPAQFGVRVSRVIVEDSVRESIGRIARSDLYEGVWLNPVRDSSDRNSVLFRPLFVHRPRQSVGVGFAYITSLGGRLWMGAYRRGPDIGRDEITGLLDISEFRQSLEFSVHRLVRVRQTTIVPTVRMMVGREQVRLYLPGVALLPSNEVREGSVFLGFERTVVKNLRYRWGAVGRAWAPEGEAALGSVGARTVVTMMNANEAPMMELDAEANSRYRRVSLDATMTKRVRSWSITPRLRGGLGQKLPTYRTFAFGGFEGFPGFRAFEVRGSRELLVSAVAQRKFWGPFAWRIEPAAGWVDEEDPLRKALFIVGHGRLAGIRGGVEVTTPLGPLRMEYGINSLHRRQGGFVAGIWR